MLVFIADLHLTDASVGPTMDPEAGERFTRVLAQMARDAHAEEIDLVLLGDVFDITRSSYWLKSSLRPWSSPNQHDPIHHNLRQVTGEILHRICSEQNNRRFSDALADFRKQMASEGIAVKTRYLIGNHDRLVNLFGEARTRAADFLGLSNPRRFESQLFAREAFFEEYAAVARHADIYDPLSFDAEQTPASLSSAILIDLLAKFPLRVLEKIGRKSDPLLLARLERLHYMRPLVDAPLLVRSVCLQAKSPEISSIVRETWNHLVEEFLEIPFVANHEVPWRLSMTDALAMGLKLSRHLSIHDIEHMPLRTLQGDTTQYVRHAFQEELIRSGQARNVVYAHTHQPEMHPLEILEDPQGTNCRIYFNAGTWRHIYRPAQMDPQHMGFLSWQSVSALALYLPKEREGRGFEMWTASLGSKPLAGTQAVQMGRYATALSQQKADQRLY